LNFTQLAHADGVIGYTLRAKPLARDYWTLSVWKDQAVLRQFMRASPHAQLMSSVAQDRLLMTGVTISAPLRVMNR
jgi:hypothetical protein